MSINKTPFIFWRVLILLLIFILGVSAFFAAFFMYQNIYSTLSNTETIDHLTVRLSSHTIDLDQLAHAEELLKKKMVVPVVSPAVRNIFYYQESVTTSPAFSTSSVVKISSGTPASGR